MTNERFKEVFEEFHGNVRKAVVGKDAQFNKNNLEKAIRSIKVFIYDDYIINVEKSTIQIILVNLATELSCLLMSRIQTIEQSIDSAYQGYIYLESNKILNAKAKEYSDGQDRLWNFKDISNDTPRTAYETAWVLASKHLSAITTSLDKKVEHDIEFWKEKCIDPINYCILITALLEEDDKKCM